MPLSPLQDTTKRTLELRNLPPYLDEAAIRTVVDKAVHLTPFQRANGEVVSALHTSFEAERSVLCCYTAC
jgi:hypothetical protein